MITIYGLKDPRKEKHQITDEIRYVGKTCDTKEDRLEDHVYYAIKGEKTHKANWIRSLLKENITPEVCTIEEVDEQQWVEKEIYWISKFRQNGHRLTNQTSGGEGHTGYKKPREVVQKSIETRRALGHFKWNENQTKIMREMKTKWWEENKGTENIVQMVEKANETRRINHPPKPKLPKILKKRKSPTEDQKQYQSNLQKILYLQRKDSDKEKLRRGKISLSGIGRVHTKESRKKMSDTRKRLIKEGKITPGRKPSIKKENLENIYEKV